MKNAVITTLILLMFVLGFIINQLWWEVEEAQSTTFRVKAERDSWMKEYANCLKI